MLGFDRIQLEQCFSRKLMFAIVISIIAYFLETKIFPENVFFIHFFYINIYLQVFFEFNSKILKNYL